MFKMNSKFLVMSSLVVAASSAHAAVYTCTGKTAAETLTVRTVSSSELLRFGAKSDAHGIAITQLSDALCGGYYSIASGEQAPFLVAAAAGVTAAQTNFKDWEGNWGYDITVPNGVFAPVPAKTFTMKYDFTYSDIAEAEVVRDLNCVMVLR